MTAEELAAGAVSEALRQTRRVVLQSTEAMEPQRVLWAWQDRIPIGGVTLLVGHPGVGKSTLLMELAARLSRGQLEGDLEGEPIGVVLATAEDAAQAVVVPRLMAAEAHRAKVYVANLRAERGERDGDPILLPDHVEELAAAMRDEGARVLMVDPLVAFLSGTVNAHRDQDVRRTLAPLARIAEAMEAAVVAVIHLNKTMTNDLFTRVSGSVGFQAAARSVLLFAEDHDEPNGPGRLLVQGKSNYGMKARPLRFSIEGLSLPDSDVRASKMLWGGEAEEGVTAGDVLSSDGDDASARGEAALFLREYLALGPKPAREVIRVASDQGISERTLKRAKRPAAVISEPRRHGSDRSFQEWVWRLREEPVGHQPHAGTLAGPPGQGRRSDPEGQEVQSPGGQPSTDRVGPLASELVLTEDEAVEWFKVALDAEVVPDPVAVDRVVERPRPRPAPLPIDTGNQALREGFDAPKDYAVHLREQGLGDSAIATMLAPAFGGRWTGHLVRLLLDDENPEATY